MKFFPLILVVALLALAGPGLCADAPEARFGHSMNNINGDVYLFGGLVPGNPNPKNELWEYQPRANDWAEIVAAGPPGAALTHRHGGG